MKDYTSKDNNLTITYNKKSLATEISQLNTKTHLSLKTSDYKKCLRYNKKTKQKQRCLPIGGTLEHTLTFFDKSEDITFSVNYPTPRLSGSTKYRKDGKSHIIFKNADLFNVLNKSTLDIYILKKEDADEPYEFYIIESSSNTVDNPNSPGEEPVGNTNGTNKPGNPVAPTIIIIAENIIFYGVPGCGKSYYIENTYINQFTNYNNIKDTDQIERVVFHQDYTYSDFIGQILPTTIDDSTGTGKKIISYEFKPGPFTKILDAAIRDKDNSYFLIIEEINRGNAPAIFGDIFQLLDRDDTGKSQYEITNENIAEYIYGVTDCKIYIPNNLFLIGTMNTSDQNVFTLDTAFQRRWNMELIPNDINKCSFSGNKILDTSVTWKEFWTMVNKTISKLSLDSFGSEDKRLGAFFIKKEFLDVKNAKYFAGKVIKYLWDDAFKMNRSDIFNTEYYPTLEEIINIGFLNTDKDDRYRIFKGKIKEEINKLINANNDGTDTTTSNGDNINNIDVNQTPESTGVDADATAETKTGINNSSENKEPAQEKNKDNSEE